MTVKYICVNCGCNVKCLFKQYSPTVLKLAQCDNCLQVADKYIEYDLVIIMIDLVLLNKKAFRHILYNCPFDNHWKLAVILLIVETYSAWGSKRKFSRDMEVMNDTLVNDVSSDLFEGESSYYLTCVATTIGSAMFFFVVVALSLLQQLYYRSKPKSCDLVIMWKAMVLSSFGKLFPISELIWGEMNNVHIFLFTAYVVISQLQAYAIVCETSKVAAGIVILCALIVKSVAIQFILTSLVSIGNQVDHCC
ncbi:protein ARV1 [Anabrus simplex]|uniref:protein ARV1 n=1 Tax=Anabrus simplex TaxID=316456 RepID=UPI0034DD33C3